VLEPDPSKPLLFVAMPFGERSNPGGTQTVDFDALYENCIKPAAQAADVEVIRADEETLGGIIHKPMYERLLLAEIVIADLTFANPNVFYELGVRHAARPRSTILVYAKVAPPPFDVGLIRAIPYELDESGALIDADALRAALGERLELAKSDDAADSPLFQLLEGYPGIKLPHEATAAFRARALWVSELTLQAVEAARLGADDGEAKTRLAEIEEQIRHLPEPEEQLLVTVMLAYRSIEAWDEMIRVAESMPGPLKAVVTLREQLALALNRRNDAGDRHRAIAILEEILDSAGPSPETLGILGRCHKDRWSERLAAGDPGAADALDEAIEAYGRGFNADPRDFYPGINLITLLVRRGRDEDLARVVELTPIVAFAVARVGGLRSRDYWTTATVLELATAQGEEELGRRALSAMLETEPEDWMLKSTVDNLTILASVLPRLGKPETWVLEVETALRRAAGEA